MKNASKITLGVSALVATGYAIGSQIALKEIRHPKVQTHDSCIQWNKNHHVISESYLSTLPIEEVTIRSKMGYNLHGQWIPNRSAKDVADMTVIICHGYTSNLYGSYKYIKLYYDRGYNVLVYDHRNHGKSGKNSTTYGILEKKDLETCIEWLKLQFGEDHKVATHGESMGAATVIQHAATYGGLEFVTADCPYSNMYDQLAFVLKRDGKHYQLPFLYGANLRLKATRKENFRDASPVDMVSSISLPLIIFHGDSDKLIPCEESQKIFAKKTVGKKKYVLIEGADHARSILTDSVKYTKELYAFLDDIGV